MTRRVRRLLGVATVAMVVVAARGPAAAASDAAEGVNDSASKAPAPFTLVVADSVVWPGGGAAAASPAGIAVDDFDRLYVSDAAQHRLVRFDADGTYLGQAGALGSGEGRMRRPGSVVTFGTLSVAVLDRENRRVLSYDLNGRLLGVLVAFESGPLFDALGRVEPVALASDRGGAMYVADAEDDRVLVFDFSGRWLRTLGGIGDEPGSFRGLRGLGAGPRGDLVAAERENARIQRLDATGAVRAAWPIAVRPGRELLGVAVDDSSRVALADEATGAVRVFDADGRLLARRDGLAAPRAVAFARDGSLWIAEAGRGAVRRWIVAPAGGRAGGR